MLKIGVTGSRKGMSAAAMLALENLLSAMTVVEAHHGDCMGVDKVFHDLVVKRGIPVVVHPPNNRVCRAFCASGDPVVRKAKSYLFRNRDIVDETDLLIALPETKEEVLRSATWSTIRYARTQDKRLAIIYPDGCILES